MPPFQSLLDAHRDDLYRFLAAMVGPDEADDCFQETVIAALRAYPRLRSADAAKAWLMTIAHRKALDSIRAASRRATPEADLPHTAAAAAGSDNGEPELWAHVRGLPAKQRAAVFLRYVGDLPHVEVAAAIGCSEEAARRNVHEGLKRLREVWA